MIATQHVPVLKPTEFHTLKWLKWLCNLCLCTLGIQELKFVFSTPMCRVLRKSTFMLCKFVFNNKEKEKKKILCFSPYRVDFLVKDNTKNLSEMCANLWTVASLIILH